MLNSCQNHDNRTIVVYDGFDCPMCELEKEFEAAEEQWADEEMLLKEKILDLEEKLEPLLTKTKP